MKPVLLVIGLVAAVITAPLVGDQVLPAAAAGSTTVARTGSSVGADSPARINGADRFETAAQLAESLYGDTGASTVFVTNGLAFPDALSAGPVAAALGAPVLLVTPTTLPSVTSDELDKLNPSTVVVVGRTASVGDAVVAMIQTALPAAQLHRIGGKDRYETSRLLDDYGKSQDNTFASNGTAYIATGNNFPDALSAAGAAGAHREPILLLNGSAAQLDTGTANELTTLQITDVKIVGASPSVSHGIQSDLGAQLGAAHVTRLAGLNRFSTSLSIAQDAFSSPTEVYLATGLNFPDALAASAIAGARGVPLLTVQQDCIPSGEDEIARAAHIVTLVGGTPSLGPEVATLDDCPPNVIGIPSPTVNGQSVRLFTVGCGRDGACAASGEDSQLRPYLSSFDGDVWRTQLIPAPLYTEGSSISNGFSSLRCASASFCVAVGAQIDAENNLTPFLATDTDGVWSVVTVPTLADEVGAELDDVECPSRTTCYATGDARFTESGFSQEVARPFVVKITAGTASVLALGSGTMEGVDFSDLSCPEADSCYAVGGRGPVGVPKDDPVIGTITNDVVDVSDAPVPSDKLSARSGPLSNIWCASMSDCVAVGGSGDGQHGLGLLETLSGTTWTAQTPPPATDTYSTGTTFGPEALDCTDSGVVCLAGDPNPVYTSDSEFVGASTLLIGTDGGDWSGFRTPIIGGQQSSGPYRVSCDADSSCAALVLVPSNTGSTAYLYIEWDDVPYVVDEPTSTNSFYVAADDRGDYFVP